VSSLVCNSARLRDRHTDLQLWLQSSDPLSEARSQITSRGDGAFTSTYRKSYPSHLDSQTDN
jgi:hypothetical protein